MPNLPSIYSIRRNSRGNAGFAAVAVGLLVLGGAAALYLQEADLTLADERAADVAAAQSLSRAVERERAAVDGAASDTLAAVVSAGFRPGPGELARLSAAFEQALASRLSMTYPRTTAAGQTVLVDLEFARVVPVEADAEVPSPLGARTPLPVLMYLAGEVGVRVTASDSRQNDSSLCAFAARYPLPLLLPLSIASRVALEASPGGRVERLVGQAAQSAAYASPPRGVDSALAHEIVRFALEAELALEFGSSGNGSLDTRLDDLRKTAGAFTAADFYQGVLNPAERFPLGGEGRAFSVGGEAGPVRLSVRDVRTESLVVYPGWRYFDGQEVANSTWGALRLEVGGSVSFRVLVESPAGSAEVGPISVPVALAARAFLEDVLPSAVVPLAALNASLVELSLLGTASRFAPALFAAGLAPDATGSFPINNTTREVVTSVLARAAADALPPVENLSEFKGAHGPDIGFFDAGTLRLDSTAPLDGARAVLTLDGVLAESATVRNASVAVGGFPRGFHTVGISIEANGSTFVGRREVAVLGPAWSATIAVAPAVSSEFLAAALALGEAVSMRAGFAILEEAGRMAGLEPPSGLETAAQAAAFARDALTRLQAFALSGLSAGLGRQRASDAVGVLKIMIGLLEAADEAHNSFTGESLPIGGFVGAAALVLVKPGAKEILSVSIATVKLAKVVVDGAGLEVTFFAPARPPRGLHFRYGEFMVVGSALAGALTLASDGAAIAKAFGNDSTADAAERVLLVAAAATDFAKVSLGIAKAAYAVAGEASLKAAAPQLARLSIAVGAALVILDLVALYREMDGNFSAMAEELVHPEQIGDLARLPGIVGGATAVAADILVLTGSIATKGGPLGIAAGLFVLAGLLVANKEKVASAIYGTLPYEALGEVRAQVADALNISFAAAAAANAANLLRLAHAQRAAAAAASAAWHASLTATNATAASREDRASAQWRTRGEAVSHLGEGALRLRFAAAALAEELDDLASPLFANDLGRRTEGYGFHYEGFKQIHYRGDVRVVERLQGEFNNTLLRGEWRGWLVRLLPEDFARLRFAFDLTETNGIPQSEFARWADKVAAASETLLFAHRLLEQGAQELAALAG